MKTSQINIATTKLPSGKSRMAFTSSSYKGLQLLIKPNSKEWHLRFTGPNGKRNTIKLGQWPEMDEQQAMLKADAQKELLKRGADPVITAQANRIQKSREQFLAGSAVNAQYRFSALCAAFIAYKEKTVSKATVSKYQSAINIHLIPEFGGTDIRFLDIIHYEEVISSISLKSKSAAQSTHSAARALFSFAVENNLISANPLLGKKSLVKKTKVPPRERIFSPAELHKFLNELPAQPISVDAVTALSLQIHTGLRIGEITAFQWSDIDFRGRTIQHSIKGGTAATTIMSDAVRRILLEFKRDHGNGTARVFRAGFDTHAIVDELRKVQGWIRFGTHDIRRTVRSYLQEMGCPHEIRMLITNHSQPAGVSKHYDHGRPEEAQLHWLSLWADKLAEVKQSATALQQGISAPADDPLLQEFGDLL